MKTRRNGAAPTVERGAAAVELALVLPILLLLVFGIIDFGRAYFGQISLNAAAREGVRLAALGDTAGVTARVQQAAPGLSGVSATVDQACPAAPGPADFAQVTVTYNFQWGVLGPVMGLFGTPGPSGSQVMTGRGVMRCNG